MGLIGRFAASIAISALLTQTSYAQHASGAPPASDSQRAAEAKHKAEEKANDEAYRESMKRIPVPDRKVDPWGGLRTPSTDGSK
jgi:hypothetical protein